MFLAEAEKAPGEHKKDHSYMKCKFCPEKFTRKAEFHSHLRKHGERGSAELDRISSSNTASSSSTPPSKSSSSSSYKSDVAVSAGSNSKGVKGSKLLGDGRRMRDEATGEVFEVERYSQIRIM